MTGTGYFPQLAERMRRLEVPEERIDQLILDLRTFCDEAQADPSEEFGPVEEFAERLATEDAPDAPEEDAQEWRWSADIYVDRTLLNRFGDQGWEIQRVDRLGRFVSHRDPDSAQRWEYRREFVTRRQRDARAAELAPEGWEPCGTWSQMMYFKRPLAATTGPAAELDELPATPRRRTYLTGKTTALLTAGIVGWIVVVVNLLMGDTSLPSLVGMGVGGFFGGVLGFLGVRREIREGRSAPI
ncbi:hypothetical protein [Streptomyces sp. NPDC005438]|uniref:hypothetical protein n=1 Tax=Streptomyces sp. NPDC005438 TaxID=3156880 RepID=UPI0033B3186D